MTPLEQHQIEIEKNLASWNKKPLLQEMYGLFYQRILQHIEPRSRGAIVELGSGIGNLKTHLPQAICTDIFPNPWLDVVCDAYRMPFANGSVSHLILLDVFHHLERPRAFLREARRVLTAKGRIILFEPFISVTSYPIYGLIHHEPVAIRRDISESEEPPPDQSYYAAQGNATRLFFRGEHAEWFKGWEVAHAEAFNAFAYLFSGGYSKPALYPLSWFPFLCSLDAALSYAPKVFASRCLVELRVAKK